MRSNRILFLLSALLIAFTTPCFGQNERKMSKNLRVMTSPKFSRDASFTFRPLPNDPGVVIDALKNAFVFVGFKVVSETSINNKKEKEITTTSEGDTIKTKFIGERTNYVKSRYLVTVNYFWIISEPQGIVPGGIQCKDIRGQIVDLDNDSEIVATFSYDGNFDVNPVADAIASKIRSGK
jgi:hypothetical protein